MQHEEVNEYTQIKHDYNMLNTQMKDKFNK